LATAVDGVRFIQDLCEKLAIPPLSRWGFDGASIPEIVAKSRQASSMRGNPIELTDDELAAILSRELEAS
jgi:alcohol dehydrogenase class IV